MSYSIDTAKKQFDLIAALDLSDPMPGDELLALQVDLCRWQRRCFGGASDWQMTLGMIEEAGEFDEAETADLRHDAIGDVGVFGCQLLTLNRLGFNTAAWDADLLAEAIRRGDEKRSVIQSMGRLAKTVLKGNQKIRGLSDRDVYREAIYRATVDLFASISVHRSQSFGLIVHDVATKVVMKRDKGHEAIPV